MNRNEDIYKQKELKQCTDLFTNGASILAKFVGDELVRIIDLTIYQSNIIDTTLAGRIAKQWRYSKS